MRMTEGSIEYWGIEYDYRAQIREHYEEALPDRITAIDRSDGLQTGELDLEAIEDRIWKHIWGEDRPVGGGA